MFTELKEYIEMTYPIVVSQSIDIEEIIRHDSTKLFVHDGCKMIDFLFQNPS